LIVFVLFFIKENQVFTAVYTNKKAFPV